VSKWKYTNNDGKHIINDEHGVLIAMVCDEDVAIRIADEHEENEQLRVELNVIKRGSERVLNSHQSLEKELIKVQKELDEARDICRPRPIVEWHEDYGAVLLWRFPIEEPPYCGTPLDGSWTNYHTHWTPIVTPKVEGEEGS